MGDDKIKITELFGAKCGKDYSRFFIGTIRRETDADGNPVVRGKIKVLDGYIYAMASDQIILGEMLDDMVLMILDKGLHNHAGVTTKIFNTDFFLN
jgi:hypothetical protein